MASIFDRLGFSAAKGVDDILEMRSLLDENVNLRQDNDNLQVRIETVEESLLEIADAFDNIGWSPLETETFREMPLKTVKKVSELCRSLMNNPFVKRGVEARVAYIWGNGVQFEGLSDSDKKLIRANRRTLFSEQAYQERERAAATDGNVFTALHVENNSTFRIPLSQITGSISNPDNSEEIWFLKRAWKTRATKSTSADEQEVENIKYYPTLQYYTQIQDSGKNMPKRWGQYGVDQNYVIQHESVNKQIGWRWGVPDVMAVVFFAKAYKEYLENNADLVESYSRIAYQIKATSSASANSAAAQWGSRPSIDPFTGEARAIGATAITNSGTEIVATGLNASSVDFTTGSPLAAGVAAGLEVSLDVILSSAQSSSQGANSSLDLPTLRAMQTRQKLWGESFTDIFEFWGSDNVTVTWRDIDEDETHRRIQSVQLAYEGGTLFQDEARKETLEMLRIVPMHPETEMPTSPSVQAAQVAADTAQAQADAAQAAQDAQSSSVVPDQGKSGSVGSVNSGRGQVKEAAKKSMANS